MRARTRFILTAAILCVLFGVLLARERSRNAQACGPDDPVRGVPVFAVEAQHPVTLIASFFGPGTPARGDFVDDAGNLFLGSARRATGPGQIARFEAVTLCAERVARLKVPGGYMVRLTAQDGDWQVDQPDLPIEAIAGQTIEITLRPAD